MINKLARFVISQLIKTTFIKFNFLFFYRKRHRVKNYLFLYILLSSFTLRLISRCFVNYINENYISIKVKYVKGYIMFYPLYTYLLNYEDLFETYHEYYFNDFDQLYGNKLNLDERSQIIDVGSHIGTFSVPIAYLHNSNIICVEPDPINFHFLKKNIYINNLQDKVKTINKAVFNTNEKLIFNIGNASTRGNIDNTNFHKKSENSRQIIVESITLNELLNENNVINIDLLKIDCEGSEYEIINDLDTTIYEIIKHIFIEIHPSINPDSKQENIILELKNNKFTVKYNKLSNNCIEAYCIQT